MWPLLVVVLVSGAAFLLRHIRIENADENRPSLRATPSASNTARRGGPVKLRRGPGSKVADVAPSVLAVAGLAGLFALLSKDRRGWLVPPPFSEGRSKAARTGWGPVELLQGLMLAVAFLMLTGEITQTFFPESMPGSSLTVFVMQGCLAAAIILLTAPHAARSGPQRCPDDAATTSNLDTQDGERRTSRLSCPSLLKTAVRPLGLSFEGAGTDALRGLGGGVIAFPVAWAAGIFAGLLSEALGIEPPVHPLIERAGTTAGAFDLVVIFASGVIVAPLAEEFFFRGFVFPSIRDRWGLPAGILVSSLLFAVVHPGLPNQAATLVLGVVFCTLYERTGTLVAPVAAHSFFNLAMLSMSLLQRFEI